jgi:hypothetical protein
MTHVKLSCGFEADVDETAANDIEFLDALTDMQDGDPTGMSRLIGMLLGKDNKKRLYDVVRDETGRASVDAVGAQLTELLGQLVSKKK